ncbi:hypothetical protein BH09VER1_BH09VER1_28340 [soil metagenome]
MKITRSDSIRFQREDGTEILAPAVTRGQMREVYALDAEKIDPLERRGRQVAVFLRSAVWLKAKGRTSAGPIAKLLPELTAEEEIDIIHAIMAQQHGIAPTTAVEIQQALREEYKKKVTPMRRPRR